MPDIAVLLHACERCHAVYAIPQGLVTHKPTLRCSTRACNGVLCTMREAPDLNEGWMYREAHDTPDAYECCNCHVYVEAHHDKYPLCLKCWNSTNRQQQGTPLR